MKVTLIAHACLLFQSKETTVISDPVLFDYLWEEINVHCPKIRLDMDSIPKVDVLNISHRHQDHFDIRTLAYLASYKSFVTPETIVLAPQDEILLEVLNELEFKNITPVSDFEPITVKDLTLTPTPSLNKQDYFPEHGLLIHDGEVTVWNQVDTIVSPDIINYIKQLYPRVDFAHHRYLPLLEGNFSFHQPLNLPFDEYHSFLQVVKALGAGFCVPGSAGFRYRDEFDFLNQYSFPTTQEQFVRDLNTFCPEIDSAPFYPGDVAEISTGNVSLKSQSAGFVAMAENDGVRVEFKPIMEVPPIRSEFENKDQETIQWTTVHEFLESTFLDRVENSRLYSNWKEWQVVYQLEVFGKNSSEIWSIDFTREPLQLDKGRQDKMNLYEGISCTELYRLIIEDTSWDFTGIAGLYRYFHNIYRLGEGKFEYFPQDKKFPGPLTEAFPAGAEMDRAKFMRDVKRWKGRFEPRTMG